MAGLTFEQAGECLGVSEVDVSDYRRVDISSCDGKLSQQWELSRGGKLLSRANCCVAARDKPAGPPPPSPPPPPPALKPVVSALATMNDAANGTLSHLRVFLSFWSDPEATPGSLATTTARVYVRHARASAPSEATLYIIDDAKVNPSAEWVRWNGWNG